MQLTHLLLGLRLRGVRRALKTHPLRTLIVVLLGLLGFLGAGALFLDLFGEVTALPPTQDALQVAPQNASPGYAIWREIVFWGTILLFMPSCYRSLRDLFHRPEWRAYVVLPISPEAIYLDAALVSAAAGLLWLFLALALTVPLWVLAQDIQGALASTLFILLLWAGLHLAAPAIHSFAAFSAVSSSGRDTWRMLAGGWVSAEAAPFLYSPAVVLAAVGFGAIPLQRSAEALVFGGSLSGGLVGVLGVLLGGLVLFGMGRRSYAKALFPALPLLREAEIVLLGSKALEREAPYGLFLQKLLPSEARPWFFKNLLGLERGGRVRWLQVGGMVVAGLLYLWRAKKVAFWFPYAAAAGALAAGSAGLLLASPPFDPVWLRKTLPVRGSSILLGRATASLFLALHVGVPLGLALLFKGAPGGPEVILAAAFAGALAGALPDVPWARRGTGGIYAVICTAALALARLSFLALPATLGAFLLLALWLGSRGATAPSEERS